MISNGSHRERVVTARKPKTAAERSAKYRKTGKPLGAMVLRDKAAIAALRKLSVRHGGVKPAIEHALVVAGEVEP